MPKETSVEFVLKIIVISGVKNLKISESKNIKKFIDSSKFWGIIFPLF